MEMKIEELSCSIIITTYNSSKTIIATLNSIISQINRRDELLIYDDCSQDETFSKVNTFLKGKTIKFKLKGAKYNNGGPAKGRNWGIEMAQGQYICFCDADDTWLPHKLLTQITFLQGSQYDFCGTRCNVVGSKQYPRVFGKISIISEIMRNKFSLSSLMFKKRCFHTHKLLFDERQDYHGVEDYELILRLYSNGFIGYIKDEILINYNYTFNSLSHNNERESELKRILVLKAFSRNKSLYIQLLTGSIIFFVKVKVYFYEFRNHISEL